MLYFAYGSNMNAAQMARRCSSATFVGIALLKDHKLAFTRYSETRGCGVADAVQSVGSIVWGVVFDVSDEDIKDLDGSEGFREGRKKNSYWRRKCEVFLVGDVAQPLSVETYFAERQDDPPPPNTAYKDLIVRGARDWNLPSDYIRELEKIEVGG